MDEQTVQAIRHELEAFFQEKFGPVAFEYNRFVEQGSNRASIDLTIKGDNNLLRRYVGSVNYDPDRVLNSEHIHSHDSEHGHDHGHAYGHISTHEIVRLW